MRREKFAVLGLGVFGSTIATNLAKHGFDVIAIDLDENTMVADLIPPQEWLNKSIVELNLRYHYEVNVIGIKRNGSNKLNVLIQPNTVIHEGDTLVLICTQESLSKISVQTK